MSKIMIVECLIYIYPIYGGDYMRVFNLNHVHLKD